MLVQGSATPKVLFVSDFQRVHCRAEGKVFSEWLGSPLFNAIKRAGIKLEDYAMCCLHDSDGIRAGSGISSPVPDQDWAADVAALREWLNANSPNVIVPLGEHALQAVCGLKGIGKWHCSLVSSTAELGARKCLPMLHPDHVSRVWSDHVYLNIACGKLARELSDPALIVPEVKALLNPPLKETLEYLDDVVARAETVAIDWEFGRGQLNCLGFAVSAREAIAIRCLPGDFSPADYHRLFASVRRIAEGNVRKVAQHAVVEMQWLARYGIELRNVTHDTMWCQKFLHPELEKGLDNVGRLYTPFPYWKDDNDDWSNIRDWQKHLRYNVSDTVGTFAAYHAQVAALESRGLTALFAWIMRFQPVIAEMCTTGLLVDQNALSSIRDGLVREQDNFSRIIREQSLATLNKETNPRSPKQLKELLQAMGMKLPTRRVKGESQEKATTDKKALVKLKRRYPDQAILPALIGISAANKRMSSYVDFDFDRKSSRVHYTLDGCGTETGRWAGYNASWGEGFNPQTVPKAVRRVFTSDPGTLLVQIDLKQAESRYVAWEGPEPKLMELLERGEDIHRYVAGKIFGKVLVNDLERQLGKKAGHAANYGTGPRTFAEACLVEMNHYLTEPEAKHVLEGYHQTFPGIRRRQEAIKREVYAKRLLRTPIGRERHFYGRMDDSTFREAYAYCPQSTIPDITNFLMLSLWRDRDHLGLALDDGGRFLLQVHDSLLLQAAPDRVGEIAAYCRSLDWHPKIELAGGRLLIPVEVEAGPDWYRMRQA